jgi:hypothetical protein
MKPHRDFNPVNYLLITLFVCGMMAFAVYLMSVGL